MSDKKKKKKEKVKYIDDGRTIADMSAFSRGKKGKDGFVQPPSTFKDKWNTYWSAVKSMLVPMFITLGVLTALFFLAYVFLGGFAQ
jgi:hypothetical protein